MMPKFIITDKVFKPRGYRFEGEVRSVFTNRKGELRVAVELVNEGKNGDGMIHIFSEEQLEHA